MTEANTEYCATLVGSRGDVPDEHGLAVDLVHQVPSRTRAFAMRNIADLAKRGITMKLQTRQVTPWTDVDG